MAEIFSMVVTPNGMWGDGSIDINNYDNVEDFIEDNDIWLVAEGGAFWKGSKDSAINKKFTAKSFTLAIHDEYKECFEYNDAIKSGNELWLHLCLDNILEMLEANPNHVCVKYNIECDISYLVIHKDDWKVLRNLRVKRDEYDMMGWSLVR